MKFRKLLTISVVTLLFVALTAGTALADSPWGDQAKPGNREGKQIQLQVQNYNFSDVSDSHWACKRIKAMAKEGIVKGYANGQFRPNASVSKIEALTMIVRLTENPDIDDLKDALDDNRCSEIPLWGQGYAAVALDEGILEEDDLDNFHPNSAAKRYEVAILLGRALNLDPDNGDDDDLDFKDLELIPDEALDYLPELVEEGYITGYHNGKFMPNKPVTRAELVNILGKISGDEDIDIDILDQFKLQGTITEIEDDSLTLKIKNSEKEFSVSDDIIVFLDNEDSDFADLEEGFKALVLYSSEDSEYEALVIYARTADNEDDDKDDNDDEDKDDIDEADGLFLSVNSDEDEIEVLIDGETEDYAVSDEVEVKIDGDEADLDDLLPGMEVELEIEENEVVAISADELDEINGDFIEIDGDEIVIEINGEDFSFTLADDVDVEVEGEDDDVDLNDLELGMEVDLEFDDGEVVKIEAED